MELKVAEYVADFLVENNIKHVFTVTGGGAMHLNDALGHKEGIACIYNHHEQACAMAAEAYSRLTGKIAGVCVTSGPGGTNAITGVVGGWLDSIPMLIISGQVKREMTISSCPELNLRQLGDQEFDIIRVVKNFTKYSVMITNKNEIAYHLEKALYLCKQGKGGPCWIDIPLDIQGAKIETEELVHFCPEQEIYGGRSAFTATQAEMILQKISQAKAPLILVGSAVRYSRSERQFLEMLEKLKIPVVTAWAANDILAYSSEFFVGVPGTLGTRAGNFAVQQCDCLLSLGCRMNVRMVGYTKGDFARNAYKIMVDINDAELHKPTYTPDLAICADVSDVIHTMLACAYERPRIHDEWLKWCQNIREKYPVVLNTYFGNERNINPYVFTHYLYSELECDDAIVCSNGSSCVIPIQVSEIKQGQRLFCNSGCAAMGYGLPAALGAAAALDGKRVICLEGDGSIMMNIQELPTVKYYHLNIKIFIYNNNGYHSIRQTQKNNFGEPLVGVSRENGVAIPDYKKLAAAFEIPYYVISKQEHAKEVIQEVLKQEGVVICDVFVDEGQSFAPKSASKVLPDGRIVSPSIDDMAPFLGKDEYMEIKNSWMQGRNI